MGILEAEMVKGLLVLLVLMILAGLAAGSLIQGVEAKKTSTPACTVDTVGTPACPK